MSSRRTDKGRGGGGNGCAHVHHKHSTLERFYNYLTSQTLYTPNINGIILTERLSNAYSLFYTRCHGIAVYEHKETVLINCEVMGNMRVK